MRCKKKMEGKKINNRTAKTQTTPNQLRINSFITHSSLHHSFARVNFLHPTPPSIPLFFYPSLSLPLQLSQCNVNDVPSIAPDSARTLTSSPPPFLHRPVISLFSLSHTLTLLFTPLPYLLFLHCSFLHLTSLIPFSLSLANSMHLGLARPLPPTSVIFPHSVTSFYSFTWRHLSLSCPPLFFQSICSPFISSQYCLIFLPVFISSSFGSFAR